MRRRLFASVRAFHHQPVVLSPADIRRAAALPADPEKFEVRVYASAFTIIFMALLLFPAITVLSNTEAPAWRVAKLSGAPVMVGLLFVASALSTLPHLFFLIFKPHRLYWQWPRQLAAGGASVATLLWIYMGNLADPLDLGAVPVIYWAQAFMCAGIGVLYGFSLNQQQVRDNEKPHVG